MSKKGKVVPLKIETRAGMEAEVAEYLALDLDKASKIAAMEKEVAEVQARHQAAILAIDRQMEIKGAGIYVFCSEHRQELFTDRKSIETINAELGFRTNPPSVGKKGKASWAEVARRVEATKWGEEYLTDPDPVLDKSKILADRNKLTQEQLDQVGLRIEQEEEFFIKPKSQLLESTKIAA